MWSAWAHAASLPYRGAQLDELLQLLEENDYENLRHARAEHVKGPMTWARLAGLAVDRIRRPLLRVLEVLLQAPRPVGTGRERLVRLCERRPGLPERSRARRGVRLKLPRQLVAVLERADPPSPGTQDALKAGEQSVQKCLIGPIKCLKVSYTAYRASKSVFYILCTEYKISGLQVR